MQLPSSFLTLAVAVPMAFAALMLAFSRWRGVRNIRLQQTLLVTAVTLNLGVALTVLTYTLQGNRIVYQLGLWPAPFGITVVADALTGIMLTSTATLVAVIGLGASDASAGAAPDARNGVAAINPGPGPAAAQCGTG